MIWKRLFGSQSSTEGEGQRDGTSDFDDSEADQQLEAALDWLDDTTLALQKRGIGQFPRYDVDLAAGRIVFSGGDGPPLALACQAVGTFNPDKATWHWGWDHPSIPAEVADASVAVRDFGTKHGLGAFTERQISASEEDAWQFAGLAGMLTNAVGTYRCPGTNVAVYVTLYEIV